MNYIPGTKVINTSESESDRTELKKKKKKFVECKRNNIFAKDVF